MKSDNDYFWKATLENGDVVDGYDERPDWISASIKRLEGLPSAVKELTIFHAGEPSFAFTIPVPVGAEVEIFDRVFAGIGGPEKRSRFFGWGFPDNDYCRYFEFLGEASQPIHHNRK